MRLQPRSYSYVLRTLPLWSCCLLFGLSTAALRGQQPQLPSESQQEVTILTLPAQFQPTQEDIGDALMLHQRYQAAIEAYRKAAPDSARVWNKLGIAYQMMFDSEDAMRCYRASLRIDSRNTHVLNNLATLYDSQGNFREAEKIYRRALVIDPQSALITKNFGTNLLAQHKYDEGWKAYQEAMLLDPTVFKRDVPLRTANPASVENRGAVNYFMARGFARAGMKDRAIEHLRSALNEGFTSRDKIAADTEFASLHDLPAFHRLISAD